MNALYVLSLSQFFTKLRDVQGCASTSSLLSRFSNVTSVGKITVTARMNQRHGLCDQIFIHVCTYTQNQLGAIGLITYEQNVNFFMLN